MPPDVRSPERLYTSILHRLLASTGVKADVFLQCLTNLLLGEFSLGFRASTCRAEYPCADGATPLPGICRWRHILRPANLMDVAQEAIEAVKLLLARV